MMYLRRKLSVAALALCMALSLAVAASAAEESWTSELIVEGTFGQSDARSMLDMINDFRTGEEAFYVDQDDVSTISSPGDPLVYSYALEEIAMQRAIEVALSFSHTRPDGTSWFTALASDGTASSGENIAAGSSTASAAFTQWKEDGKPYSGQGHRRNMLNASFQAVGIGHVTLDGTHYWVQEFARSTDAAAETTALDEARSMSVTVSAERVASAGSLSASPESVSVQAGEAFAAPVVAASVMLADVWPNNRETTVTVLPEWTSLDPETVKVDGQQGQALKNGATSISGAALGQSVTVPVSVGGSQPASAAQVYGNSLSLLGDIGVNFYLTFPEKLTADSGAYVTLNGEKFLISDAECSMIDSAPEDDYYKFTASVVAKKMNDAVTLRVYRSDGTAYPLCNYGGADCTNGYAYSVADYLQKVREKYGTGPLLTLAEAMSDYGSCAQTYFNYNVETAAPLSDAVASVTAEDFQPYEPQVTRNEGAGIQYLNSNLTLDSETTLRHFFQLDDGNIADYEFTVDGVPVAPVVRDGQYCVEIPNIVAKRLNVAYTVKVHDAQGLAVRIDNYSALSYCKAALEQGNEALQNLARAMYLYQQAAEAYFNTTDASA